MKTLKFRSNLVQKIKDGRKTTTWRLFDDKDLSVGDKLQLLESETGQTFAEAEVVNIREKQLGEVQESDFATHEKYESPEEMLSHFKDYYGDSVTMETLIKMVDFNVLRFL